MKRALLAVCKTLYAKGYLAAADGNVSLRLAKNRILITPSGRGKASLRADELAIMQLDGKTIRGTPSSERLLHQVIYQHCPLAKAVIHAHPPTAIAWTIAKPHLTELPATAMSELILALGALPIVPYARPGTQALADQLIPYLGQHRVMIMARHGAVAWGESLQEALFGIERLEHSAEILWRSALLGGITELPAAEVAALKALRQTLGPRTI